MLAPALPSDTPPTVPHLQAREGTDHDDTQAQAASEQRVPAHLLDDVTSSGTLLRVQLGHQVVWQAAATASATAAAGDQAGRLQATTAEPHQLANL